MVRYPRAERDSTGALRQLPIVAASGSRSRLAGTLASRTVHAEKRDGQLATYVYSDTASSNLGNSGAGCQVLAEARRLQLFWYLARSRILRSWLLAFCHRAAVTCRVGARMAHCSTRGPCAAVSRGRAAAKRLETLLLLGSQLTPTTGRPKTLGLDVRWRDEQSRSQRALAPGVPTHTPTHAA